MSIKFVTHEDETTKHGFYDVGTRISFATVKTPSGYRIRTAEILNKLTGEHIAFGIPQAA